MGLGGCSAQKRKERTRGEQLKATGRARKGSARRTGEPTRVRAAGAWGFVIEARHRRAARSSRQRCLVKYRRVVKLQVWAGGRGGAHLRRHLLFFWLHIAELPRYTIALGVKLLPLAGCRERKGVSGFSHSCSVGVRSEERRRKQKQKRKRKSGDVVFFIFRRRSPETYDGERRDIGKHSDGGHVRRRAGDDPQRGRDVPFSSSTASCCSDAMINPSLITRSTSQAVFCGAPRERVSGCPRPGAPPKTRCDSYAAPVTRRLAVSRASCASRGTKLNAGCRVPFPFLKESWRGKRGKALSELRFLKRRPLRAKERQKKKAVYF